jgi:putative ABC transport system substrate-binding protein
MSRRKFIRGASATAVWYTIVAQAQSRNIPEIGFLNLASASEMEPRVAAFRRGLAEAGYIDGANATISFRWAEGKYERLTPLASDLVQRHVEVIVATGGGPSVLAAKTATSTIPIVFTLGSDPVQLGLVRSLNRPSGNITGVTMLLLELAAKRLEMLHELVPRASSIGLLVNRDNDSVAVPEAKSTVEAAHRLGLHLSVVHARSEQEIDQAFSALARGRAEAVVVGSDAVYESRRKQLVAVAAQYMLPTLYPQRESVELGGLASYGTDLSEAYRQAGIYVGKILGGAKPAALPVLQLNSVELVINVNTAKALGLVIPQSLLLRADEVIQ